MSPSVMLDVDLILKVKGQAWQRRSVTTGETKVCDVEKAYVVLANHDQRPTGKVSGTWVVEALRDPCPHTLVGQITSYLKTTFVDAEGNEWLQNEDNVTIHLEIATNEYGDFIAARGSTYHIVSTSGPFSGCREDTDQSGSIGLPEGSLPNPLADSAATAHASFGGGGTEAGSLILLEINVATNCGAWLGAFQFTLGADGIWRHDLVVPREPIAAGFVESESHGTMTGGP